MICSTNFSRVWWLGLLAIAMVFGVTTSPAWADPSGPTSNDRHVAFGVISLLKRDHLLQHPLDDEIAQRTLKNYLGMLDPMKVYFYQSDLDEFEESVNQIDDMLLARDTSFGYRVFKRFLQRVDERVAMVDRALAMDHDFTADEEMIIDSDAAEFPKTPEEAWQRWRKRIKYDLLVLKATEKEEDRLEGKEAVDKLTRRYHSFAKRMHRFSNDDLLEMFLTAVSNSFDPHTSYMSSKTLEDFNIIMKLELEGIGASLQSEDGIVVVRKLIPGGAAEKAGILAVNDKIIGVGQGDEGEIIDVVDMPLSDVVKLIRGPQNTVVRLELDPADASGHKIIDITRAKIKLEDSAAHELVIEEGQKPNGQPYKIGVIDLPSFYMDMEGHRRGLPNYRSTTRDVRKILENFNRQGVDAVVLDLRRNGGGSLNEAINLTGLFIDEGPVVQVKGIEGTVQPYYDLDSGAVWKGPLVILTSKYSASASEILAGAIQDYHRGLIVGDRTTHGKGTVQSLMNLSRQLRIFQIPNAPKLGAVKITIQQFYRPNGDSTQNRGVLADVELPSLTTHLDVGEADLDYPVAFDKVDETFFPKFDHVNRPIVDRLCDLSAKRCKASEDFQKVERNIKRYKDQKQCKYVTLNEKKFMAERAELNADKEQEKEIEKMIDPNRPAIERDYYLDEALAITLDYIQMMNIAKAR